MEFLAIDFELASRRLDSACALGIVHIKQTSIVRARRVLIRPPSPKFTFTGVHGLTWKDVEQQPDFRTLWERLARWFDSIESIVAHNAPFDRSVLVACCRNADLVPPALPWICTRRLARRLLGLAETSLPSVCDHIGFPLLHHDPLSDARAAAQIVLHAITRFGEPAVRRLAHPAVHFS